MEGTLQTDLWKSETSRQIKNSYQYHLKLYWFSQSAGCGSKIGPATPILGLEYK